jgi:hypothetical protein
MLPILLFLISFVLCEIAFRALLFSDILKNRISPHYFANLHVDDNVYRLQLRWEIEGRENEPIFPEFDPIVGHTAEPVTEDNPLGIVIARQYTLDEFKGKRSLLFFGDSFIRGFTDFEYMIPQLLEEELDSTLVLNFGANGYGLDQMYLRLRSVIDLFDEPHVMVGLIYADLDRCLYKVMHTARPYFEVSGDSLALKGVPLPATYGEWLKSYPITIKSYIIAGLQGLVRRAFKSRLGCKYFFHFNPSETNERREEKRLIVRKLIEDIKKVCDARNARLTFVVFPGPVNMIHKGWYESFLSEVFGELNIDYMNLTEPFRDYVKRNGLRWYRDLYTNHSHPTEQENVVLTNFIAHHLTRLYDH